MNELDRPRFSGEISVSIPKQIPVEHNLDTLEEFAIKLNEFYGNLVFSEDNIDQAKKEKAEVNKLIDKVKRLRIDKVKEYKQPIDDFEQTAKHIESELKDAVSSIQTYVDKAENIRKEEKLEKVIRPIIKVALSEAFNKGYMFAEDKIIIDNRWFNKTYKEEDIDRDIELQVSNMIIEEETIKSDIETIKGFNSKNEDVYIERYKHTRDLASIIRDIQSETKEQIKIDNSNMFDVPETKVSKTFRGTNEQINKLIDYAKSIGLEVL